MNQHDESYFQGQTFQRQIGHIDILVFVGKFPQVMHVNMATVPCRLMETLAVSSALRGAFERVHTVGHFCTKIWLLFPHFLCFYARSQDDLLGVSGLLPWWRRGVQAVAAAAKQHSREAVLIPHKSSCQLFGLVLPHGDTHRVGRHAQGDEWGNTGRCVTSHGVRQVYKDKTDWLAAECNENNESGKSWDVVWLENRSTQSLAVIDSLCEFGPVWTLYFSITKCSPCIGCHQFYFSYTLKQPPTLKQNNNLLTSVVQV